MKKTLKRGERQVLLGSQERSVLLGVIYDYLETHKKDIESNHLIKRHAAYLNKILSKILRKKRCCHCGHWI